jgi:inward rectifier potassium channel
MKYPSAHPPKRPELRHEAPENAIIPPPRLVGRGRSDELVRYGLVRHWWHDNYHSALTIPWWGFLLITGSFYIGLNLLFACLYLAQHGSIANVPDLDFADAFFFSVQTMATIGYGQLVPQTIYANVLVTIEALIGMLIIALTTGLVFARFSRPTARILFSQVATIGTYDGVPTLFVRAGNERKNQILRADVSMHFLRTEVSREGSTMRRFYDMKLARARTPLFGLTFLIMHVIDQDSPLFGLTANDCAVIDAEIIVTISGLDETMSQTIHARTSFTSDEIRWDHRFVDIFGYTKDGRRAIDFSRFHDTEAM